MTTNPNFKTGDTILLAEGKYSDYSTGPLFRCVKDLNIETLAKEFYLCATESEWNEDRRVADASTFTLWLTQNGWVEEIEYREVNVGSYGIFECCGFTSDH